MTIRQEEQTPIGDYFHDSGVWQTFNELSSRVDDFEVDTDMLNAMIDNLLTNLKGLKGQIKKCETEYTKYIQQRELHDRLHRGAE